MQNELPDRFEDVEHLEEVMSRPSPALVEDLRAVDGGILVVGAGGKMGPTVARMAKRATPDKRIVAVARFSEPGLIERLQSWGVETVTADLLDQGSVEELLPRLDNIVFMAGRKFGSTGREDLTWAMNTYVPALVAHSFPEARVVAYSTLCVYPFVPVAHGGATEETPVGPPGEYAMSCVGRERMFEYISRQHGTPGRLLRLSYAIDMRYGVLHDIATAILAGREIDLAMGHANVIWQGDAASQSLRALRHVTAPTSPLNISGPEIASIRHLANKLGQLLGKIPRFTGTEADTAWVADTSAASRLFGYPDVTLNRLLEWTADWVSRDMPSLAKPTKFSERSGDY